MKCINCGKYPFCNKIENSQQEACKCFIKRKIIITTNSPLINGTKNNKPYFDDMKVGKNEQNNNL